MKLMHLPLLMEGLHQVKANSGEHMIPGPWFVKRYAEIPPEWEQRMMRIEQSLAQIAGLSLSALYAEEEGENLPDWLAEYEGGQAIEAVYEPADNSAYDVLIQGGLQHSRAKEVVDFFEEFFDGDNEHDKMRDLFITHEYQI